MVSRFIAMGDSFEGRHIHSGTQLSSKFLGKLVFVVIISSIAVLAVLISLILLFKNTWKISLFRERRMHVIAAAKSLDEMKGDMDSFNTDLEASKRETERGQLKDHQGSLVTLVKETENLPARVREEVKRALQECLEGLMTDFAKHGE
ncbi:hypothetical protein H0H81_000231 [Sphagnurus paluster]|uniref:Uncharacterized protein n=1 Tax=Sphagnurus paluster TaxID=117069 RepID=A0A9P7GMN1_9AGAR|nr:hypothetical protein H0H81_000231 [Sphagnurus paluster]